MAATRRRRRRTRRHLAAPIRRRRRRSVRRNPIGLANPRRRVRRRRRRTYRRNPFGGKLLGGLPSMTTIGGAAIGATVTPILLRKLFIKKDAAGAPSVPGWMAGSTFYVVSAIAAVVLGGLVGKFASKKFGAAFALGGVLYPATTALQSSSMVQRYLAGIGEDYGELPVSGYGEAVEGLGFDPTQLETVDGMGAFAEELELSGPSDIETLEYN